MLIEPGKVIFDVVSKPKSGFFFLAAIWFLQLFFHTLSYMTVIVHIHYLLVILIAVALSPLLDM